jgi:hypothetical protein
MRVASSASHRSLLRAGRLADCSVGSQRGRYHRRVRRLIKVALIALGIRWFLRWRRRRRGQAELERAPRTAPGAPAESDPESDPADELRQKLAESRAEEPGPDDAAPAPEEAVEDRRAAVHEQGRAALDEMTSSDES